MEPPVPPMAPPRDSGAGAGLGESQRHLLDALKRRGEAAVAELTSDALARETVRDHLKSLEALGLVERAGVRRKGPGRPEVLYRLSARGEGLFPRRHGDLLRELVEFLDSRGQEEVLWSFFDARSRRKLFDLLPRLEGLDDDARVREVARALTDDGFLAEVDRDEGGTERLRLCHCPWRELVAVSRLPCQAEIRLVSRLLGRSLTRESYIPDGDASCTYRLGPTRESQESGGSDVSAPSRSSEPGPSTAGSRGP